MSLYLLMGWLVVVAIRPLVAGASRRRPALAGCRGLFYTVGVLFYALDTRRMHYGHGIFHLFVLAGSILPLLLPSSCYVA